MSESKMELTSTDAKEVVEGKKSELKPGVGNDDVTEEEVKAMAELKKALVGAGLEDRFTERELWPFLFARKLDISRSLECIKNYLAAMAKYQIDPRKLKMSDMNKELVESNYTFWPGTFDQHGRPIVYILLGRFEKAQSARDMMLYTFYFFYKWQQTLPLSAWRAGVTYVEDLSGVGWKHFRALSGAGGQEANKAIQNAFPMKIKSILILNPGWIFRSLIKLARFFVKQKIIQRTLPVTSETLFDHVPRSAVITEFGGEVKFDGKKYIDDLAATDPKDAGAGDEKGDTKGESKGDGKAAEGKGEAKAAAKSSEGKDEASAASKEGAGAAAAAAKPKAAAAATAKPEPKG